MMLEGTVDVTDFQCQKLLGDRYFRINPDLPEKISLDEWKRIPSLVKVGEDLDLTRGLEWLNEHWT